MQQNESQPSRKELLSLTTSQVALKNYTIDEYDYICELPYLGPILVSAKKYNTTTLVMIKSVLGWLTYTYLDNIVGTDSITRPILISLYRYFSDVIDGWSVSFKSKKSKLYNFFNIFSFRSSNQITTGTALDPTITELNRYIKTKILCDIDQFLLPKFINRFAQITCFDVKEIENFTFSDVVRVNMNQEIFKKLFPDQKIREVQFNHFRSRHLESFSIKEEEITSLKNQQKEYKGTIVTAIKEFLITEGEYFLLIDDVYMSEVYFKQKTKELSKEKFDTFFGLFVKIYEVAVSFIEDLYTSIRLVKKGDIKIIEGKLLPISSVFIQCLPDKELPEYDEACLLQRFVDCLIQNSQFWIHQSELFAQYEDILRRIKIHIEKGNQINLMKISAAFDHILQRLIRYPSLIKNVLDCCFEESENRTKLIKFYLQLTKFIRHSEILREQEKNVNVLHIFENILKVRVIRENQHFVDQLDCFDKQGNEYTFFLFSNQTVLMKRSGKPLPILQSTATYQEIQKYKNSEIELYTRGQTGFYLIGKKYITHAHFIESYKNCTLSARYFISNDEDLRNRFIRKFSETTSFFSHRNLLFISARGDFTSKIIKDTDIIPRDMKIYQITQNQMIQNSSKNMPPIISYVFSCSDNKIVYFYNNDLLIKIGSLTFYVIDFKNLDDLFHNLHNILKAINQHYLKIEEKISLYQYLKSQIDRPFSSKNENLDFKPLINFLNDDVIFESMQIYCNESSQDFSLQKSSQILEPQGFLRSKFIMQEILEINSEKKLTEFNDTTFSSVISDYEPKQVEDIIVKILDNEEHMILFKKIFKSHDDVHRTIINYLSRNVYCYLTHEDLQIIKIYIKQGEDLSTVPIVSNKSIYKLILKYFKLVAHNDRSYLVNMFLTRIFYGSSITDEEINRVTQQIASLD